MEKLDLDIHYKKLEELDVYMEYYIAMRSIELQWGSLGVLFFSFEDFLTKSSGRTDQPKIDEWKSDWKGNYMYDIKT